MTLVRSAVKTGRSGGNVIVQDYQALAYAATLSITTTTTAEQTLVQVAQLTGALTINIGVANPLIGDSVKFLYSADGTNRNVTYGTGFTAASTDTVLANGTGNATFIYNGTSWDKASYNYQASPVDIQTPAYAATISLTTTLRTTKVIPAQLTGALTINAVVTGAIAGDVLEMIFGADGTNRVITFGTNFKSSGTMTVVASKFGGIRFMYDGTEWVATGREISA